MLGSETVNITGKKPRSSRKQAVIHQCFSPGFSNLLLLGFSNLVTKTSEKPVLPRNISTREVYLGHPFFTLLLSKYTDIVVDFLSQQEV